MYKQLIFVASILLITSGVSAKEASRSSGVQKFEGLVMLSESVLSSEWMEKFTVIKSDSPKNISISTCCFGCPKPIVIESQPSHICLPLDNVIRIVTKTKRKFSIENKDEIRYLYVPENSNNIWFNAI